MYSRSAYARKPYARFIAKTVVVTTTAVNGSIIQLKRSSAAGSIPSSLFAGELAVNLTDKKLYSSDGSAVFSLFGGISGSNTDVMINDSGSISGTNGFEFSKTTNNLTVANTLISSIDNASTQTQVGSNVVLTTSALTIGNSTVNSNITSTLFDVADSTSQANQTSGGFQAGIATLNTSALAIGANVVVNAQGWSVGNSTINVFCNSSQISIQGSNTFNLGTPNIAANGFNILPNGLIMQWGFVGANSKSTAGAGVWTLPTTFPTGIFSAIAVSNLENTSTTFIPGIPAMNTSTLTIRTSNATVSNVFWMALGH